MRVTHPETRRKPSFCEGYESRPLAGAARCHPLAQDRLNVFLKEELADCQVSRVLMAGEPATVISEFVRAEHVDLVMMPTHGCGAFRRFLLGSIAAKVLHDVHCPVWTSSHVIERRLSVALIPEVIVCAVDFTPAGDVILRWASELATEFGSRLIVVHAVPALEFCPEIRLVEGDRREVVVEEAQKRIRQVLHGSRTPAAEVRVEGGTVTGVVRAVAEGARADLLIIERATNAGLMGRLRTNSYAIIRESPCPVMSV